MPTFAVQVCKFACTMDNLDLLRETIRNFQTVGAVAFSSKFLVKKMTASVDFERARCIVELGTGNGCITRSLLRQMHPKASLLSFEINERFYEMVQMQISDKRLSLICDSAERLGSYLPLQSKKKDSKADYIISSLPLVALPKQVEENVLRAVRENLKPNGYFIQYSYSTIQLKKFEQLFGEPNVKIKFTALNLPPAFVYICHNVNS